MRRYNYNDTDDEYFDDDDTYCRGSRSLDPYDTDDDDIDFYESSAYANGYDRLAWIEAFEGNEDAYWNID